MLAVFKMWILMNLEQRLVKIRKNNKLNAKDISKKIGISERSWYYYEKDASKIQFGTLQKIAKEYSINFDWLLTGSGEMNIGEHQSENSQNDILNFPPIIEDHFEVIKKFEDHEKALGANEALVFLEKYNPDAYEKALSYIRGLKDGTPLTKSSGDRRKKSLPFEGPDRRKKAAS
jgi:transcriptional regulator with XRE-family HTH domain